MRPVRTAEIGVGSNGLPASEGGSLSTFGAGTWRVDEAEQGSKILLVARPYFIAPAITARGEQVGTSSFFLGRIQRGNDQKSHCVTSDGRGVGAIKSCFTDHGLRPISVALAKRNFVGGRGPRQHPPAKATAIHSRERRSLHRPPPKKIFLAGGIAMLMLISRADGCALPECYAAFAFEVLLSSPFTSLFLAERCRIA